MNRHALTGIAPDISRKRLLVEGCGEFDADRAVAPVREFFDVTEHEAAIF